VHKYRGGLVPSPPASPCAAPPGAAALAAARATAPDAVSAALAVGDFRTATGAVWAIADEANRYVSQARPWLLSGTVLDAALVLLVDTCRDLGRELEPFLPGLTARIAAQCTQDRLPQPQQVFARLNRKELVELLGYDTDNSTSNSDWAVAGNLWLAQGVK
jgi:methionyl-tRNA synthetase